MWWDVSIGCLEIPTRAHTVFLKTGVRVILQIEQMTFSGLRDLPGMGPKTAQEVRGAVDRFRARCHAADGETFLASSLEYTRSLTSSAQAASC